MTKQKKLLTRQEVLQHVNAFLQNICIAAVALAMIHLVPKGFTPSSTFRLLCTLLYFAAAISLCWMMIDPRSQVMHTLYEWRFRDSPNSIGQAWRRYLYSLDRLCRILFLTAMIFLSSTLVSILGLWFYGFRLLQGLNGWIWWLSLLALVLLPFAGGFLISDVWSRRRFLLEQVQLTSWYTPRSFKDLYNRSSDIAAQRPVEVTGDLQFVAGGHAWHWDDFTKNCFVFGQSGSGKTICVMNALLDGLMASSVRHENPPSGLILDPKGDFRGKIKVLCRKYNRLQDLLIINPQDAATSIHWNPLDTDDDELELASRFAVTLEALGMKQQDTTFWIDSAKKFLRHAICLLRLTNPPSTPPSLTQVGALAASIREIADRTDRLNPQSKASDQCLSFFANEWIELASETRSSIQAYLTNMIDPFLMEPYSTLFSGKSTMRIADMVKRGKILYVDMPIADKEAMSRVVGTFIKLEYFREILKSPDKTRPSFFLCDEFQAFFTASEGKGDAAFLERSRQSNHVNILSSQNLPGLLKHSPKEESVLNLLGNCAIKMFLRNADSKTNQFGSALFGQRLVAMGGSQAGTGAAGIGRLRLGGAGDGVSGTDQYDSVVRPEQFAELILPSRNEGIDYCEVIVHHGARAQVDHRDFKLRWKVHPIE